MGSVVPFDFDGLRVRVVAGDDGQPRFVAKDVADALGYAWGGSATIRHVPDQWKGVDSVLTPSGFQEMTVLSEQGVYFFVVRSDKPGALKFQEWLAGDVLPSIRKTGGYQAPRVQLPEKHSGVACLVDALHSLLLKSGCTAPIAGAATLGFVHVNTGLDVEPMRLALPAHAGPTASLNASAVGKLLSLSAVATNKLLASCGLQTKNARGDWELTEAGRAHGEALPYSSGKHAGYQLM